MSEADQPEVLTPVPEKPVQERQKLGSCACGKTPENLFITAPERSKWGFVAGDCCGEWTIEFRNGYTADQEVSIQRATEAWNNAPRG